MLQKTAAATIEQVITTDRPTRGIKIARSLAAGGPHKEARNPTIPDDLVFDPGNVYTLVRGISARVNNNHDGFPRAEILGEIEDPREPGEKLAAHNERYGYRTFTGKYNHLDHHNTPALAVQDPVYYPRGVILAARYVEEPATETPTMHGIEDPVFLEAGCDAWVELLVANSRKRWPRLCHKIERGEVTKVSMGAEVAGSRCGACGNFARHEAEFCTHVVDGRGMRGMPTTAEANSPHVLSGTLREGDRVVAHEVNHGLEFFEISWITDEQADPTAVTTELLQREEPQDAEAVPKAASLNDSVRVLQVGGSARSVRSDREDRQERRKERREDSEDRTEELVPGEFDYRRPPDEQDGAFSPTRFPFPCSARRAANEANPLDPLDETINVEKCQGCMYNLAEEIKTVDCQYPDVVREDGADPLPVGYAPPEGADDRVGSGFFNDDGSPIRMLPKGSGQGTPFGDDWFVPRR